MSGESAQDIEVSITAPNRSFHATVIASDVSWQDRSSGTALNQSPQLPRRPVWSSAFGESTDLESESLDPMINSGTSLSQDSLDGFAVEFISSKENIYLNGNASSDDLAVEAAAAAAAAAHPDAAAAAAAFTAPSAAADAVSSSIN
ncbi:hypothetical protein PMAYCL1PPCAC_19977 [Pristionchus mayeri]|uniref:Uncharacterized protein n=1 Tax=Pristionchus mayeri TaxID=1317129 RepID=A0AAN5I2Q0_9BILA|nr:hypothetical protein PMAYCL1PPCAC_19977 [Pristionchus mayeri]